MVGGTSLDGVLDARASNHENQAGIEAPWLRLQDPIAQHQFAMYPPRGSAMSTPVFGREADGELLALKTEVGPCYPPGYAFLQLHATL